MTALVEALNALPGAPAALEEGLRAYADMLGFYNRRLNLVARTDTDDLLNRHIAHCLWLARYPYAPHTVVLDWGTGGGLPLIPLALALPQVAFVGVDAVEKKTLAVRQMARQLGLENVDVVAGRAEHLLIPHTHSVSRATAPLLTLWNWHAQNALSTGQQQGAPDLICLKGGDLNEEIRALTTAHPVGVAVEPVGLSDPYFASKKVVAVRARASSDG